jgi:hypothetical protein
MKSIALASLSLLLLVGASGSAAAAASTKTEDRPSRHRKHQADGGDFQLSLLSGVGFPRPFSLEAMMTVDRSVSLGIEYSFLPNTTISGIDLRYHAIAADMRVFPLRDGPFFFGMRAGRQHVSGATTVDAGSYGVYDASVTMDTWFVNPRVGLFWTWPWGLSVGMDAGVQIPFNRKQTNVLPDGVEMPEQVAKTTDFLGGRVLPTVTLLQLGLTF